MKELKREIIGAVQDSIDLTDNQVSIPTLNIMLDEILPEQLRLYFVSQQSELLKAFLDWQQNKYRKPYDVSPKEQIEDWEAFNCG